MEAIGAFGADSSRLKTNTDDDLPINVDDHFSDSHASPSPSRSR